MYRYWRNVRNVKRNLIFFNVGAAGLYTNCFFFFFWQIHNYKTGLRIKPVLCCNFNVLTHFGRLGRMTKRFGLNKIKRCAFRCISMTTKLPFGFYSAVTFESTTYEKNHIETRRLASDRSDFMFIRIVGFCHRFGWWPEWFPYFFSSCSCYNITHFR